MNKKTGITDYLLEEIRSGRIKAGDLVPSRQELMKKFGCARATVDAAVTFLIEKKILSASRGAGTYVAGIKASNVRGQIAIISRNMEEHSMQQEIAYSFMTQLSNKETVKFYSYDEVKFPGVWEKCKHQKAIVFIMPDIEHGVLLHEVQQQGIPHLVLYRDIPESSFVSISNSTIVSELVKFIAGKGCSRIAYFGLTFGRYHFPERRYIGYLEGLLESGLEFVKKQAWLLPVNHESVFYDEFSSSDPFPDALVVDEASLGPIITRIQEKGLTVGKDFILAKFQTIKPGTYPFPIASTGSVTEAVGKRAAEILERILEKPQEKIQHYIKPDIIFG